MFSTGNKYLNTNRADAWKFNVLNLCFSFHFVSIHMDFFPLWLKYLHMRTYVKNKLWDMKHLFRITLLFNFDVMTVNLICETLLTFPLGWISLLEASHISLPRQVWFLECARCGFKLESLLLWAKPAKSLDYDMEEDIKNTFKTRKCGVYTVECCNFGTKKHATSFFFHFITRLNIPSSLHFKDSLLKYRFLLALIALLKEKRKGKKHHSNCVFDR